MRKHALNRWNYSDRCQKWVYVELDEGKRVYKYSETPPEDFEQLTLKIQELNQDLMEATSCEKKNELFKKLMTISQKMQAMRG